MRVCLSCGHRFESDTWNCDNCGFAPENIDGFLAFAPELARSDGGYDPGYFQDVDQLIERSFWMKARKNIFIWAAKKYFPRAESFLEIGCATGMILSFFRQAYPHLRISGFEIFTEGLRYVPDRVPDATVFQADARQIPFGNEFDAIGAFDVIEHVDDDQRVLDQMFQAAKPGGGVLVSVPHHPFMWSQRDEYVRHKRRYTRADLAEKIANAGFELTRMTAFVSIPFPAMIVESLLNRKPKKHYDPLKGLQTSAFINGLLTTILAFERQLIKTGVSFPFGGSLLAVARKRA
jgi:SAM-dependent methyltransferase